MSRWLTSVVAKVMKLGKGHSAPRRRRRACLGIESLSSGAPLGARSLAVRPEVEQLEERRLLSSSGVVSAITDNYGHTTAFEIGGNGQVYELNPTVKSTWFPLVDFDPAGFRQVSAGLDGYGRAVCYALHNGDNHVWEMDNYKTYGFTTEGFDLGWDASQISATRNNECFTIHQHTGSDWVGIYSGAGQSWSAWNGPWGGLMQITTGVDRYGHDEVYMLNGSQQVYRLDNGIYCVLPMRATQISAGAGRNWTDVDLFYIDTTWANFAYHYDGTSSQFMTWYVAQISAGLDQYGNEVLYSIDTTDHSMHRQDLLGGWEHEGGVVSQISAAGNDLVFAVCPDQTLQVFDRDWAWGVQWTNTGNWGSNGWHFISSWTANPYYAPLAA
jgi:hypothetical protein